MRLFVKVVAGKRQHGGSSSSHNASVLKTQSNNCQEAYRDMSGSGKDVHGSGESSADHVSTAKEVCVCGKDTCTVLQALRKQLKDLRLELDGSKKVESPSWAVVINTKPIPSEGAQPAQVLKFAGIGPIKEWFYEGKKLFRFFFPDGHKLINWSGPA